MTKLAKAIEAYNGGSVIALSRLEYLAVLARLVKELGEEMEHGIQLAEEEAEE